VPSPFPGPIESAILAELAPTFTEHKRGPLRHLEGGSGSPLVFIHGRGSASTTWFPLLPTFARKHHVFAVDLPGFGSSESIHFNGGDFEAGLSYFVDPVEEWLTALGLDAIDIVGHSLGGLVATEIALRRRVNVKRLVLIAAMGLGPQLSYPARAFFRLGPERLARTLGPAVFPRVMGSAPNATEGPRLAALTHELHSIPGGRPNAATAFNALFPALGPVSHRQHRLGEIDAPTLLVWGDRDPVFPSPIAIAAATALPRAQLCVEPVGHSPHIEMPARVLPTIASFLDSSATR